MIFFREGFHFSAPRRGQQTTKHVWLRNERVFIHGLYWRFAKILDVKDERFHNPESRGIEEILIGIRKTARNDQEILEKGMAIFDTFYASKT